MVGDKTKQNTHNLMIDNMQTGNKNFKKNSHPRRFETDTVHSHETA